MFQTNNTAQLNSLRLYPKLPATQVGLHEFYITTPLYVKSRLHEIRYIIPYSLCILNKMELSIIFSLLCFYVLSYLVVTPPPPPPFSFSFAEFNTFSILQKPKMGSTYIKNEKQNKNTYFILLPRNGAIICHPNNRFTLLCCTVPLMSCFNGTNIANSIPWLQS